MQAATRNHNSDKSDSLSKAADPGNLNNQKEWVAWSHSLRSYLSTILGQGRVPLSYVVHEKPDPKYDGEDEKDYGFEKLFINRAPLYGLIYNTDAHEVHHMIREFMQGGTAETYIKPR